MTADEAKQALKEGKKVRHTSWYKKAFIRIKNMKGCEDIVDEKGREMNNIFERIKYFKDEWRIVE